MGAVSTYDELRSLFSYAENLPQAPNSPLRLSELLELPDASPIKVEELILADPALTAGILKTASAAAFGRSKPVTTVREAVMVLGFRCLRSIAVALWTNALVAQSKHNTQLNTARFAQNGVFIGTLASLMHQKSPARNASWSTEEVFAAGILHNVPIGLLSILAPYTFDDIYGQARRQKRSLEDVFEERFDGSIKALGGEAAKTMGLPIIFAQSIAGWEHPDAPEESMSVLKMVDIAAKVGEQRSLGVIPWKVEHEFDHSLQSLIDIYGSDWRGLIDNARHSSTSLRGIAA